MVGGVGHGFNCTQPVLRPVGLGRGGARGLGGYGSEYATASLLFGVGAHWLFSWLIDGVSFFRCLPYLAMGWCNFCPMTHQTFVTCLSWYQTNPVHSCIHFHQDNKQLGTFRLDGIPPAPRGVPQIEVKFDIDTNGILSVTATDKGTGKQQDIKITGASTLSDDDVDRMVQDAEKFAAEDEEKKKAVETKNQGESMIYQTEKQMKVVLH